MTRSWLLLPLLLGALLMAGGCSPEIDTTYGSAESPTGYRSINGFGVLRQMFEHAGWRTTSTTRLSSRLDRAKTLVWTPDSYQTPREDVTVWLDQWLQDQPGRTLVYVQKDYLADADYWRTARAAAPPDQRFEYRRRAGRAATEELRERVGRTPSASRWFVVEPLLVSERREPLGGRWAAGIDDAQTDLQVGIRLSPADEEAIRSATQQAAARAPQGLTIPGAAPTPSLSPAKDLQWERLLVGGSAEPLPIALRLTREAWGDSQVIVVAGGSFLSNYGLLPAEHRRLAARVIAACGEPDLATFVASGPGGLLIREAQDGDIRPAGLELLTVWPISLVTLHIAAIGLLALVALLPIFGRPARIVPPSSTDFGRHISGMAELLSRTGDVAYARRQISDYFVQVRGEEEGPWVLPPAAETPDSKSIPAVPEKSPAPKTPSPPEAPPDA